MAPDPASPRRLLGGYLLLLAGGFLLLAALYLSPDLSFAYFGSDTGEYYRLTVDLIANGRLPIGGPYQGWGTGYPDFPGLFVVAGGVAQSTGVGAETALILSIPLLSAFSVVPLFLLFRRLVPNEAVALLGAGFASVAMPRAFSMAHPAPLALGDLLGVAALWMFVEGRSDARWYLPLSLTAGAVILTHHLSSYFFLVGALGGLVVYELFRPGGWSRRFPLRELVFLAGFLIALDAYWFGLAPDFVATVIGTSKLFGLSARAIGIAVAAGAILLTTLAGLLISWRRRHPGHAFPVSFPSDRSVARDAGILAVLIFGGIALLTVVPVPGTTQTATVGELLFFTPVLVLGVVASGTRRLAGGSRLGPFALAWLLAIGGSAIFGLVTASSVLPPTRHAEYLVIPLGLLAALALVRWAARARDAYGGRGAAAVAAGALLLLAANAAIAFPPAADLGHFQEGLTPADAALGEWSGANLPGGTVIASDHRVSSLLFGFDDARATWDTTPALFTGENRSAASAELNESLAPHTLLPVQAVAVDATMRSTGVALNPSGLAEPMSASATAWLEAAPFVPLYENGPQAVYWVSGPLD